MTNTPKPQANTLDEKSVTMILDDGNETQVIDVETVETLITEARVEQIMQDELSLMDTELPEEEIIQWRLARLTQLKENK